MGMKQIMVLGFAGSLRKGSYNKMLLHAAAELMPKNAKLEIFEIDGIPLYNQDLENDMPAKVKEFKEKIRQADAILIATPEYNYSFPGVLKNAIDWASRPPGDNSFEGKPVAIMSASIGWLGGARAQYQLRQVLITLNMHPINRLEVMVPLAEEKFDGKGRLVDEKTRAKLRKLLESLVVWSRKLKDLKEES